MSKQTIRVPDIGGADSVEVIEISVAVGDRIAVDDSLIVLESDKASMEVPSPLAGEVLALLIKEGDTVSEGSPILELESGDDTALDETTQQAQSAPAPEAPPADEEEARVAPAQGQSRRVDIIVPDLGDAQDVEVIEITASAGDELREGDSLLVMESDKASMELPAPLGGTLLELTVTLGDKLNSGDVIGAIAGSAADSVAAAPLTEKPTQAVPTSPVEPARPSLADVGVTDAELTEGDYAAGISALEKRQQQQRPPLDPARLKRGQIYAGPAVRAMARELGVALAELSGSGPRGRILKEDVQNYVKSRLSAPTGPTEGSGIPALPEIDFAQFGEVELVPMSGIHKATVSNMSRSWLNVPHVTQFDDADVSELEDFRASLKPEMEKRGVKLTPLPFLLKAAAIALREHPKFNSSLHADGERVVYKKYFHIGLAVDTPRGLMVPVLRNVLEKSLWDLAEEARELAGRARERKLKADDMQGACFTISSLGGIGGTGFTPIVNAPEVAILGVSRLSIKPVWNGKKFKPRKMLPLGLSYDHRQINGADAGAFLTYYCALLGDIRRFLL